MKLELAKSCLADAEEASRKAGVILLTDEESPEAEYLLILCAADASEAVWQSARTVLVHRSPWLVLEPSIVHPVPDAALSGWMGENWLWLRRGIKQIIGKAGSNPAILPRLLKIPGVIPDLIEELTASGQDALAQQITLAIDKVAAESSKKREILMAPTYRCNLTCSYCYAKGFSEGYPPDMSLDDLAAVLDWAASHNVASIFLCGGEPTTYTYLPQLLQMARSRGIQIRITSNGVYSPSVRELIAPPAVAELVGHYDQERMISSPVSAQIFETNLHSAMAAGVLVMLRYTMTEQSSPVEWRALIDLALRLSIPQINFALAFKGSNGENSFFKCQDAVGFVGGRLEGLLTGFFNDATASGIRLHLSKPFPLCALQPESLRRIFSGGALRTACTVFRDGFSRNITVNPDSTTFPCSGIAVRGPKITEFSDLAEAGRHSAGLIGGLLDRPYAEQCTRCVLWYRGFCQGACLTEQFGRLREEQAKGLVPLPIEQSKG
jgi:radical SAM protein with 4Fe4S-binding SPASM domain